jgi:elongation factor Ts
MNITKAEGKPEAAWPKIVEGRLGGWYKERVLLDQPFVRDDKQTVAQLAASGGATIVRYAQLFIGG